MNAFIKWIAEMGVSEQARSACILMGALMLLISSWWYGPRLGLSKKQMLLSLLVAYPVLLGALEIIGAIEGYFAINRIMGISIVTNSGIKLFIILPFLCYAIAKILKIELNKLFDLFAVMQIAEYPICTMGCLFTGCCRGYVCDWGVYSPATNEYYFPIQIINSMIMVVILLILILRANRLEFISDGKQLPIMLILFGGTRIITEFFMDIEKPFFGFTAIAMYCIVMVIEGVILLEITNCKRLRCETVR